MESNSLDECLFQVLNIKQRPGTLCVKISHQHQTHPSICPPLYFASFVHSAPNLNHKTKYLDRDLCWIWPKAERLREALVSLRSHGRCNTSLQHTKVHTTPCLFHATTQHCTSTPRHIARIHSKVSGLHSSHVRPPPLPHLSLVVTYIYIL